jgi:hypothetical protein
LTKPGQSVNPAGWPALLIALENAAPFLVTLCKKPSQEKIKVLDLPGA